MSGEGGEDEQFEQLSQSWQLIMFEQFVLPLPSVPMAADQNASRYILAPAIKGGGGW